MEFFVSYMKEKKGGILAFFLFCAIFAAAFYLYDLPLGAVLYPAAVCAVVGAALLARGYLKALGKHRTLLKLKSLPGEVMEPFPEADTWEDSDYQAIIAALRREEQKLSTEMNRRYQDMVDYYTIWAHQIKTPIAAMGLTLQNQDTPLSRQLSQELQRIEQYVQMVLVFLRLDGEGSDYVFRQQDLDPIIREAVRKFAGQFVGKKLRLSYTPVEAQVLTDEKWLSFVVEQVLSNAVKYTPAGGTISVYLEGESTLCIRDTGLGIAPEDLPRVFEKSYTGYNGRSHKKASGLGLYLCREICNHLGHTIKIESALDTGTVVKLNLGHKTFQAE